MYSQVKPKQSKKSKKGVSIIIGYVLLITFAVIIGIIIYKWMKTYVPQEDLNCPDGTSLFIESQRYDCDTNMLTLSLLNNGRFDVGGYFIYASNSPEKKLATIDLTQNQTSPLSKLQPIGVKFGNPIDKNSLEPRDKETELYNLTGTGTIYLIEIVPIRWQTQNRKMFLVSCKDAKITEEISCFTECSPETVGQTCGARECGTKRNNCNELVNCPPGCTDPEVCNLNGQCVLPDDCTDTCTGLECGFVCDDIVCGEDNGLCTSITFPNAETVCSENLCELGVCDDDWGNCDEIDANGCEANLTIDPNNCGYCGTDCGSEDCVDGICTLPLSCDGTWTGASENSSVECDRTPTPAHCTNCVCDTLYDPDGLGGCWVGGTIPNCPNYCYASGYSNGNCRSSSGNCVSNGGTPLPIGDPYCTGGSNADTCCCYA
ncbi:MAG: hypothetical protein NTZ83_05195 [Candidatus Pacearchaeota archaeon]|nr:hypothetical protein [Candidatus Pacearchaeota archaeon]